MLLNRILLIIACGLCAFLAPLSAGAASSTQAHRPATTKHAARNTGVTKVAGKYILTLVLKPAKHFYAGLDATQESAEGGMKVRGGDKPMEQNSSPRPNHFLGVIIKEKQTARTVKDADVEMSYAKVGPGPQTRMKGLPVVKMTVIGKGVKSMRYGNNARLLPGSYRLHVTINKKASANFTLNIGT